MTAFAVTQKGKKMDDLISRQAAIDAVKELCLHYTPTKSVRHPHIDFVVEELERLPSAQPDVPVTNVGDMVSRQQAIDAVQVVRCKDCKYYLVAGDGLPYCHYHDDDILWQDDDFCSRGESNEML